MGNGDQPRSCQVSKEMPVHRLSGRPADLLKAAISLSSGMINRLGPGLRHASSSRSNRVATFNGMTPESASC